MHFILIEVYTFRFFFSYIWKKKCWTEWKYSKNTGRKSFSDAFKKMRKALSMLNARHVKYIYTYNIINFLVLKLILKNHKIYTDIYDKRNDFSFNVIFPNFTSSTGCEVVRKAGC